jgi:hypothetical protein
LGKEEKLQSATLTSSFIFPNNYNTKKSYCLTSADEKGKSEGRIGGKGWKN